MFDQNYIPYKFGFDQIDFEALEDGTDIEHDLMQLEVTATKNGYAYIYLSNENDKLVDVFFDDFKIEHEYSGIIQQEDFYAFGLSFDQTPDRELNNKYLFNSKELQTDLNLDWYDFGFRFYNPQIARFTCLDPIAEDFAHVTPYNYAENKPINGIDLWGLQWVLSIYSPQISNSFHKAVQQGNIYEQRRLTNYAINNSFPDDFASRMTFMNNQKPIDNMAGSLVFNPDISGVKVMTYSATKSGHIVADPNAYLFARSEGRNFDKGFPVDVRPDAFYTDAQGNSVDFVGLFANASASLLGSQLKEGNGMITGHMKGMGYVQFSSPIVSDNSLFNFGVSGGAVYGNFSGKDYLNNGLSSFTSSNYFSKNSGNNFRNNNWNLSFDGFGSSLGLPTWIEGISLFPYEYNMNLIQLTNFNQNYTITPNY